MQHGEGKMEKVILEHDRRGAKMCLELRKCGQDPLTSLTITDRQLSLWLIQLSPWTCCCSVTKSCSTLHDLMDCSRPGPPVLHCHLEFAQTRVHWVSDSVQPPHPLPPTSPVVSVFPSIRVFSDESALHQLAKTLELQPLSFQWISFWRKVLLVYISVKYFAMCVVHNLSGALCERWGLCSLPREV